MHACDCCVAACGPRSAMRVCWVAGVVLVVAMLASPTAAAHDQGLKGIPCYSLCDGSLSSTHCRQCMERYRCVDHTLTPSCLLCKEMCRCVHHTFIVPIKVPLRASSELIPLRNFVMDKIKLNSSLGLISVPFPYYRKLCGFIPGLFLMDGLRLPLLFKV